jgi:hypothetical protein
MQRFTGLCLLVCAAACSYTLRGMRMNQPEIDKCQALVGDGSVVRTVDVGKMYPGFISEKLQAVVGPDPTLVPGAAVYPACTAFDRLPPWTRKDARDKGYQEGNIVPMGLVRGVARPRMVAIIGPGDLIVTTRPAARSGPATGTLSMRIKLEGLKPEEQENARALGYQPGDLVPIEFDLATHELRILPPKKEP